MNKSATLKQKGLTKREVIKIVTPGTVMNESALTSSKNNYIALIYEENHAIYLAGADISTGECSIVFMMALIVANYYLTNFIA